jgi:hypothetical protein
MEPIPVPEKLLQSRAGQRLVFDPPPGSETVGKLEIFLVEDMRALLQGGLPEPARWISWWQPSDKERELLCKGAPIRLEISGATQINPMSLKVGRDID